MLSATGADGSSLCSALEGIVRDKFEAGYNLFTVDVNDRGSTAAVTDGLLTRYNNILDHVINYVSCNLTTP